MKKVILSLVAALGFASVNAQTTWSVDNAHSSIGFSVNHFFTPTTGKFDKYSGNIALDPANLSTGKADFTVEVASINTQDGKRDKHLQSDDFFHASKFSQMKFVTTRLEKKDDKNFIAYGKLTIRDVTKEVALPFKILGVGPHPMKKGKTMIGLKSDFTINRNEYGVGSGSWAATAVVGDEVEVKVILEAVNQ